MATCTTSLISSSGKTTVRCGSGAERSDSRGDRALLPPMSCLQQGQTELVHQSALFSLQWNATMEGCSVLSGCRKAGAQAKDGVRTLGPVWMPIRRAGQTTALVSAVAQSQLWRSSTSPSLASKRQNPSPGKGRVAHNEGVALAARRRWLPTASAATKSADHEE